MQAHADRQKECPHTDKEQMFELGWANILQTPYFSNRIVLKAMGYFKTLTLLCDIS